MQNPHFGWKIKNAKRHAKNVSTTHCSCSLQKSGPKKQLIFEKWEHFKKLPKMAAKQRLEPLQNPHFGSKNKDAK